MADKLTGTITFVDSEGEEFILDFGQPETLADSLEQIYLHFGQKYFDKFVPDLKWDTLGLPTPPLVKEARRRRRNKKASQGTRPL